MDWKIGIDALMQYKQTLSVSSRKWVETYHKCSTKLTWLGSCTIEINYNNQNHKLKCNLYADLLQNVSNFVGVYASSTRISMSKTQLQSVFVFVLSNIFVTWLPNSFRCVLVFRRKRLLLNNLVNNWVRASIRICLMRTKELI